MIKRILLVFCLMSHFGDVPAQRKRPYDCGPILKKKSLASFERLNTYLGLKEGTIFAEVGASSGYYNGAMAVYLDGVSFYLQDIDESCLNKDNLDRVLNYYSKFRKTDIRATNDFHIVIGTTTKTNLPVNTFDVIYSNATYHVLEDPDAILTDLRQSLKNDGVLVIRDAFIFDGRDKPCEDKTCLSPRAHYHEFIKAMNRNEFRLIHATDEFGYPAYKFKKAN